MIPENSSLVLSSGTKPGQHNTLQQMIISECGPSPPAVNAHDSAITDDVSMDVDDKVQSNCVTGHLIEDLGGILEGNFGFMGSFSYAETHPQAPNPCLTIQGIGTVGLPLSERDANLIISQSSQAPFGKGEDTVVDTEVRDTWEIDPSKVHFTNSAWSPWVETLVSTTIWKALGVAAYSSPPRCELYKLLLYRKGSHFLPHQDTSKADGMFATIIILLPSAHSGGQVHVSHSGSTQIFDFSSSSSTSTSVLAWYTDVVHEVKPVTSGYRLALSYNLISSNTHIPSLPNANLISQELRQLLQNWKNSRYFDPCDADLLGYLLKHQYSEANLKAGLKELKGEDAHKVNHILSVAHETGFEIFLGKLSCRLSGEAGEYIRYGKRDKGFRNQRKWNHHDTSDEESGDDNDAIPGIGSVSETELMVTFLVDINGNDLLGPNCEYRLDEECLVPQWAFDGQIPDDYNSEGYLGNHAGDVEHWYNKTVLLIIKVDKVMNTLFCAGGVHYGLQLLALANNFPPSDKEREIARLTMSEITSHRGARELANYALKWNDCDMWKTVVESSRCSLVDLGTENIIRGLQQFPFESTSPSLENMLKFTENIQSKIDFINMLRETLPQLVGWCHEQSDKLMSSYDAILVEDIPSIISIVKERGLSSVHHSLISNVTKKPLAYTFWVALVKGLRENRDKIPFWPPPTSMNDAPQIGTAFACANVDEVIQKCLDAAVSQWNLVIAEPKHSSSVGWSMAKSKDPLPVTTTQGDVGGLERILELSELCISTNCMLPCSKLLFLILKSKGDLDERFRNLYLPLIPRLKQVLNTQNIDIYSPPFLNLMQLLIAAYLRDILGSKINGGKTMIRKLGCSCADCKKLNIFMESSSREYSFRAAQPRRTHLEIHLASALDLCRYDTIKTGSPYCLVVTKLSSTAMAATWEGRRKHAISFLDSIGDATVVSKVMGGRYDDVLKALDGVQPFTTTLNLDPDDNSNDPQALSSVRPKNVSTRGHTLPRPATVSPDIPQSVTTSPLTEKPDPSTTAQSQSSIASTEPKPANLVKSTNVFAGQKRKKGPLIQLGPAIDLSADDSA